jgi:hypothetical protein
VAQLELSIRSSPASETMTIRPDLLWANRAAATAHSGRSQSGRGGGRLEEFMNLESIGCDRSEGLDAGKTLNIRRFRSVEIEIADVNTTAGRCEKYEGIKP